MGLFGAAHWWMGAKRPSSYTNPTMMKPSTVIPHLKEIQKTYESQDALLELCWHQHS